MSGHSPEAICARLWKRRQIALFKSFDAKASILNQCRYMPGHVAALKRILEKWLKPSLPYSNLRIRGKPMFEEDEAPAAFEDSADPSQRLNHARNRADREGAYDSIYG